jgi:hypothetical protein
MTQLLPKTAKAACFIVTRDRAKAKEFHSGVLGIWSQPGSTNKVARFNDPDGNNLSLAQL